MPWSLLSWTLHGRKRTRRSYHTQHVAPAMSSQSLSAHHSIYCCAGRTASHARRQPTKNIAPTATKGRCRKSRRGHRTCQPINERCTFVPIVFQYHRSSNQLISSTQSPATMHGTSPSTSGAPLYSLGKRSAIHGLAASSTAHAAQAPIRPATVATMLRPLISQIDVF